jgi:hypothetical protein
MQIAILLFDRFTCLDAIGPYQVLSGLPGAEVSFVAERPGPISDEEGSLVVTAQAGLPDVPGPDVMWEDLERPCGRGLMLMRYYMTEVAYADRGRAVRMSKVRNGTK